MPPRAEGEGVEPPRPAGPPVFETGYRAGGSPSESGPGRRRTCTSPLKRRQLCRLSYGAVDVTGRDRTCDAPRFRRALYRAELRSRVEHGRSRSRTGGLLRIREALCHLSYPPSGRGWTRTSSLLFVRQALSRLSYSPSRCDREGVEPSNHRSFCRTTTARLLCHSELSGPSELRDKDSNLDLHVQSVASCRLRRSRNGRADAVDERPPPSVEERDVPHGTCAAARCSSVRGANRARMDRGVVRMANRALRIHARGREPWSYHCTLRRCAVVRRAYCASLIPLGCSALT